MRQPETGSSRLPIAALAEQRVAVWGYGREGRAAIAALRRRFPDKLLTLICPAAETESVLALGDERLFVLDDPIDATTLAGFDVVIKSPGISPYREPYLSAQAQGVRFTSGSALWFVERAQARTICVTGTKGKSTVSALIAHLLRTSGKRVALAGNIGLPLLDLLDPPSEPDWWVIELSSFQTRDFDGAPSVAVITNLYEEHLDWHRSRDQYAADKLLIGRRAQRIVVNALQPELRRIGATASPTFFNDDAGWHVRAGAIYRGDERILTTADIPLPGLHNAQNVCAALAAIDAAGEDAFALASFVKTFHALPHRLQTLGSRAGLTYVNDSISTTPYAAIEALRSLPDRAVSILVGGFDRGLDWQPFVDFVAHRPPHAIVAMGANGAAIASLLAAMAQPGFALLREQSLASALSAAQAHTPASGTILLSPGAPSFDQFHDYAERGRQFARLAGFDPASISQIDGLGIA
jgi:UDP-N-acetylmuramoyl-L-alanine---L-glutamate ligase